MLNLLLDSLKTIKQCSYWNIYKHLQTDFILAKNFYNQNSKQFLDL